MRKRDHELILGIVWALLYIPYILYGGLLRDDLGFLIINKEEYTNYFEFQAEISSFLTMTARPVSAILHGLCYWNFGTNAWAYHFVNLGLFLGSIMFFYLSVKEFLAKDVAFLSALFAMVYPCASGTLFSSIMMNSNFAGFSWSLSLYLTTTRFKGNSILSTILLLMSALSYEAFIPLFLLNVLVGIRMHVSENNKKSPLFPQFLPVITAIFLWGFYRKVLERCIFGTSFSRIITPNIIQAIYKLLKSIAKGLIITIYDSMKISIHALNNLNLLTPLYLLIVLICLVVLGYNIYKSLVDRNAHSFIVSPFANQLIGQKMPILLKPYLGLCILAFLLFIFSFITYSFSDYSPTSRGFENRTMGGIRFSTALLAALGAKFTYQSFQHRVHQKIILIVVVFIYALFTLSIIGQREAWILAAKYNDQIVQDINQALNDNELDQSKTLTIVAILPKKFPGEVNEEPILGVPWDITPLLSLTNPSISIRANVYNPKTEVYSNKITINKDWEAWYPFWLYVHVDKKLVWIKSQGDWYDNVK